MKILFAEDNEDSRLILRKTLESAGHTVREASNGADALQLARKEPPEMLISDILMPGMDGFVLCSMVKEDKELRHIPFIFCTATYTDQADEKLAISLGASRFLVKPVETAEFLRAINEVIQEHLVQKLLVPQTPLEEESVLLTMYQASVSRKLDKKLKDLEKEICERRKAEREREIAEKRLKRQTKAIEQKNLALKEMLEQMNLDTDTLKRDIAHNVETILLPIISKLSLSKDSLKYRDVLNYLLHNLVSAFGHAISEKKFNLTEREIEICSMIKGGLSNRDICGLLRVSQQTIEKHRKNIRKKLGLIKKKINLASYLHQLNP